MSKRQTNADKCLTRNITILSAMLVFNATACWCLWLLEHHPNTWTPTHQIAAILAMTIAAFTTIALLNSMQNPQAEEEAAGLLGKNDS